MNHANCLTLHDCFKISQNNMSRLQLRKIGHDQASLPTQGLATQARRAGSSNRFKGLRIQAVPQPGKSANQLIDEAIEALRILLELQFRCKAPRQAVILDQFAMNGFANVRHEVILQVSRHFIAEEMPLGLDQARHFGALVPCCRNGVRQSQQFQGVPTLPAEINQFPDLPGKESASGTMLEFRKKTHQLEFAAVNPPESPEIGRQEGVIHRAGHVRSGYASLQGIMSRCMLTTGTIS